LVFKKIDYFLILFINFYFSKILLRCKKAKLKRLYKNEMEDKTIVALPNEVIQKNIMVYLSVNDLRSFGRIAIEGFKEMAEAVIEKRRE